MIHPSRATATTTTPANNSHRSTSTSTSTSFPCKPLQLTTPDSELLCHLLAPAVSEDISIASACFSDEQREKVMSRFPPGSQPTQIHLSVVSVPKGAGFGAQQETLFWFTGE
ncbi:hypothetical protein I317_02793 [Kwoniella heveanensis CBS 569]|nr:hypothetical protein I317_02793 [Kwoniella heveanensis CBS 569]